MKAFATLFTRLDSTTRTTEKVAALAAYLAEAPEEDRLWTVALFSGRRPKRLVTAARLRDWVAEAAGLPGWLVEESYAVVGDLAETIALLLPGEEVSEDLGLSHWIRYLQDVSHLPDDEKKTAVLDAWTRLGPTERLLFNKLVTGGFRVGVSQKLMTRALARATGQDEAALAHRLMGDWTPATTSWHALIEAEDSAADAAKPYPFCLAHALDAGPEELGPPAEWHAEWKWDGIRAQLVLREGAHHLWSRGEELITDRFPELARAADFLPPGTVLDGELLAWADDAPMPFADLQKRLGRKSVPRSLLTRAPVILCAYDLLEWQGRDLRANPFARRRALLEGALADLPPDAPVILSRGLQFEGWDDLARQRATARDHRTEGVMLKAMQSPYHVGRKKGDWWKWKLDPLSIDAVMLYAQPGHGRRANLFTDFTFAVRAGNDLVPFTKAYSGLTDAEFRQITAWVRKNTVQKFGPVRQVTPQQVFEIAFEGIQASSRHKSGVALRFPRMARWRRDKPVDEINSLDDLNEMLRVYG